MKPQEIANIRGELGMSQVAFGKALGVSPQTVSHWERGYRKASSLAVRAIEMLRELGSMEKRLEKRLREEFNRLNAECFKNQIKGRYRLQLSGRMKGIKAKVLPSKGLIRFSRSYLLDSNDVEPTLKHEMVHLWLYERGRPWGHTREFKTKLKSIGG